MLKLLLDEHIATPVAAILRRKGQPAIGLAQWREGALLGQSDSSILQEAAVDGYTLVTYDRRTIPPILKSWAEAGHVHGGVVFVDQKTISPSDIGGLVRALEALCKEAADWDWTNRICFLHR